MKNFTSLLVVTVGLMLCPPTITAQEQGGGRGGPGGGGPGGGGPGGFGGGGPGGFGRGRIIDPPTDFIRPPTMRLGLLSVLKDVGGPEAEKAIAEVLRSSARGVELAYATAILEKLAPGKYRDIAIAGAKDLLQHPIAFPNPTRYDRDANAYLYGVLVFYKDKSFASAAQTLLVNAEGRIDGATLEYLNRSLEGQAIMSAIGNAYYDARITNQADKASLLMTGLRFTGMDQQANRMFMDTIANEEAGFMRFMAIRSLARTDNGGEEGAAPATNPQVLLGRQQLLQAAAQTIQDERLTMMVQQTAQDLQNLIEGKPVQSGRGNPFGGGGPPGGFGGRPPGGGDGGRSR